MRAILAAALALLLLPLSAFAQEQAEEGEGPLRFSRPDIEGLEPGATGEAESGAVAEEGAERIIETLPPADAGRIRTEIRPGIDEGVGEGAALPATPTPPPAPVEPVVQPLRLGFVPSAMTGRGPAAETLKALDPLRAELADAVDRAVEFVPAASYRALIDAQVQRRIDGGFYSSAAYATAETRCRCLDPLVAPVASDGTTSYYAIVVARPNAGISSLDDLEGKRVAIGAKGSVAGRLMQFTELAGEGHDPATFFGETIEAASPLEAVPLVATGEADAAFAWSSMEGDPVDGYTRGTLSDLVRAGQIDMNEIAVVWRSAPIGHAPFAVLAELPEDQKAAIEEVLVALPQNSPEIYDRLDPLYGGGFAPVEPEAYRGVAALLADERAR